MSTIHVSHKAYNLDEYKRQINELVDVAISFCVDNVLSKETFEDDAKKCQAEIDVEDAIQEYLTDKWANVRRERLLARRLKAVPALVEQHLVTDPTNGEIYFCLSEERDAAERIVQSRGYQTTHVYEEGYEGVKYWPQGIEEPFESL